MTASCNRCDYTATSNGDLADHAADTGHWLCLCCPRSLCEDERQTCVNCLGRARRDLTTIDNLIYAARAALADAGYPPIAAGTDTSSRTADTTVPGGDLLVLLAPGSDGSAALTGDHWRDERPDDPQSITATLTWWMLDWRRAAGATTPRPPSLATAVDHLREHMSWAAQHHPDFHDFASDLGRLARRLETALGMHPQRSPVPCLSCHRAALERAHPAETSPDTAWQCTACHQRYTDREYYIAVRQQQHDHDHDQEAS